MATVAFHTLGCKVNSYESEAMLEIFKKEGMTISTLNLLQMYMLLIHVLSQIQGTLNQDR